MSHSVGQLYRPPVLVELYVEACYPTIKHDTVHRAFQYYFQHVPKHFTVLYLNILARAPRILNHAYIQVEGIVYRQTSGLSQGSAAETDHVLFFRTHFCSIWNRFCSGLPARGDPEVI